MYTYRASWRGETTTVESLTPLGAQMKAAKQFGAKWAYEVTVIQVDIAEPKMASKYNFAKGTF